MRFMILRKAGTATELRALPGDEVSLQSPSKGACVTFSGGKPVVVDRSSADPQAVVAGLTLIDANSKEDAIEWVKRWSELKDDREVEIEIREGGCPGGVPELRDSTPRGRSAIRFAILLKSEQLEQGFIPEEQRLAAMTARNNEAVKAGVMLAGEGLQPSSKGARLKFSGGRPVVVDGPFAEAKELIAGFWLIQVSSKDDAINWVKDYPYPVGDAEVEIRQVFDMSISQPLDRRTGKEEHR